MDSCYLTFGSQYFVILVWFCHVSYYDQLLIVQSQTVTCKTVTYNKLTVVKPKIYTWLFWKHILTAVTTVTRNQNILLLVYNSVSINFVAFKTILVIYVGFLLTLGTHAHTGDCCFLGIITHTVSDQCM